MKIKSILLPGILILAPTAFLPFTHQERAFGQNARPEAKTRTLPKQGDASKILVDDRLIPMPKVGVVPRPRPDLTIKKICTDYGKDYGGGAEHPYLNILIANTGGSDAGFFEIGITYFFADEGKLRAIEQIPWLNAGEERWVFYNHQLYGFDVLVGVTKFQVIADPKYLGPSNPQHWDTWSWHMPRILESNEKNNELTVNNRDCSSRNPVKVKP